MPSSTITTTAHLSSIDEELGPRETRFFGEGFKRVAHALRKIAVDPGSGRIEAEAGLRLPADWSRKGTRAQPPHLSTIDVMLFSAQLAGLYLAHTRGLGAQEPFAVRRAVLRAGTTPLEERLDRFAVAAIHRGDEPGARRSRFDCRVGTLAAQLTVEHGGASVPARLASGYSGPERLPGPWNTAPYGADHRRRTQRLINVDVDRARRTAEADLLLRGGRSPAAGATMIDLFVSALQLGQVLLYRLDGFDRAASETLWMRRTVIERRGAPSPGRLRVALEHPRLLDTAAGAWRSADITTAYDGLELRCSVAHRLPTRI